MYPHTDFHTVYYAYTYTQQVLTILLVLVTNVSHFSMYIICVTDGYPDFADRILALFKYLFFRVCHGLLTLREVIKYVGFDILLLTGGKISRNTTLQ